MMYSIAKTRQIFYVVLNNPADPWRWQCTSINCFIIKFTKRAINISYRIHNIPIPQLYFATLRLQGIDMNDKNNVIVSHTHYT